MEMKEFIIGSLGFWFCHSKASSVTGAPRDAKTWRTNIETLDKQSQSTFYELVFKLAC